MGHKRLAAPNPAASYPHFMRELAAATTTGGSNKPLVVRMSTKNSERELEKLVKSQPVGETVDNYAEQYAELLLSRNAHLYQANYSVQVASIKDMLKEHYGAKKHWQIGSWVYYPWSQRLVHVLEQDDFETLRTIRNRDLITGDEQKKLFDFETVCFGMSVGSASALALGLSGISRRMKLVDGAVLSGSNLNRIMTGVQNVGLSKATVIGRQLYEMNPYSEISYFDKVEAANAEAIFDKPWATRLAIDEIDDLEMKTKIRVEAKKRRIPVVMASELGDTVVLDVERHDQEDDYPIFHGSVPGVEDLLDKKIENRREWMKIAVKILDPNNMSIRLQESLMKIGTTIVTHPQLGSTVMVTGGVIAFAVKNIALGQRLDSGRYVISLENSLLADHGTRAHRRQHKQHTKIINRALESM